MKQKTHSASKKRFKITGSKNNTKVVGRKASARHLLVNKSTGQKNLQGKAFIMSDADSKTIKKLLNK